MGAASAMLVIAVLGALVWPAERAHASAWNEGAGALRVGLGYGGIASGTQFAPGDVHGWTGPLCPEPVEAGDRSPYSCVTGGRFHMHTLQLELAAGLTRWLTLEGTLPVVVDAGFSDDLGSTTARGIGDIRFGVRLGGTSGPWALAGVLRAKAPTGPVALLDRDVPVGEGQWDLEPGIAAGVSLWPRGWIEIHQALRLRFRNARSGVDSGDEWVGSVGGGVTPLRWLAITAQAEWSLAAPDRDAFGLTRPGRKLLQTRVGLALAPTDAWWIHATVALPIAGQRWPAGPGWFVGVAYRFDLRSAADSGPPAPI